MALSIVSTTEIIKPVSGRLGYDGNTFTRCFIVKTSGSSSTAADEILLDTGTPAMFAAWPKLVTGRRTPVVVAKTCAPLSQEAQDQWLVTVEYSNDPRKIQLTVTNSSEPWDADPLFSYDFIRRDMVLEYDSDGDPVVNSAGDPFDPPIMIEKVSRKITIKRATKATYNPETAADLIDTINSDAVTVNGETIALGNARLLRWEGSDNIYYDDTGSEQVYQDETIEIEVNIAGHDLDVLDMGYRYRPTAGSNPVKDTDENGTITPTPIFLNADGTKATSSTANVLTFSPYPSESWTAIGLS